MSSGHWYQYATTSNRIKQTYVNGFLDISGDLVVRNNNFNINGLISQNTDTAATNAQYTYISWNDVSGTFATVGNPTFSNNITVNQNTKTATLSVTGDSSLNKLFLNGNLAVGKTAVTSGTTLDVSGVAIVSSKLAINNATYASMTNSSNNTRVLVTGDSTGTNADVSGQVLITGSTDTNSRMGFMLDTTTANFPIGKIQVNQTNVGGGQRLALNPAGGKVGITAVPDASGTQLEVAGGIASKEPTTGNAGVGTFVKTLSAGTWHKLAQCGDPQSKVTFRVVGLVTYQNNTYNIDVTTTQSPGTGVPISSILLNNTIGSNVFTDANIDFVVVYDITNSASSYYIKCNSNAVYCALTIYVTTKNANSIYSKLRFYQDRVFTLSYAGTISTSVDTELSGTITQFVISTHSNTTYPMVVSSSGNVGIKNNNPAFALDVSGTSNIGLTNGGVGLYLNSYSSTSGPYLSLKHNGSSGKEYLIGSTGTSTGANVGKLEFFDATSSQWRLQIGTAGGLNIKQPQYRDATMSLANTFTKSGIRIAGDLDEADSLCMGIWGDTAGNNGTGYIQNMWDTPGAPLARDLLLNPLGGNVAIGKTAAAAPLDIEGALQVRTTSQATIGSLNCGNGQFLSIEAYNLDNSTKRPIVLAGYGGNVAIGKTTANATLDVSGRIIVNGSISYSNYYFKFVCVNSLALSNGTSIGFTNSTGTPYRNSGYTQDRYFLAPVDGYYHLSYVYNLASNVNVNNRTFVGFYTSGSDPTGLTYDSAKWTNANFLAIHANETNSATNLFIGTITTNVYLTSGQRVYVVVAWNVTVLSSFTTYSWGHPAANIWTGYLISQ